jgi:hypothetical protein
MLYMLVFESKWGAVILSNSYETETHTKKETKKIEVGQAYLMLHYDYNPYYQWYHLIVSDAKIPFCFLLL